VTAQCGGEKKKGGKRTGRGPVGARVWPPFELAQAGRRGAKKEERKKRGGGQIFNVGAEGCLVTRPKKEEEREEGQAMEREMTRSRQGFVCPLVFRPAWEGKGGGRGGKSRPRATHRTSIIFYLLIWAPTTPREKKEEKGKKEREEETAKGGCDSDLQMFA